MSGRRTFRSVSFLAVTTLMAACTDIRFDNPIDSNGSNGEWLRDHPEALDDSDTDGIANYFEDEKYRPQDTTKPRIEILGEDTVEIPLNDPNDMLAFYLDPNSITVSDPGGGTPTILEPTHAVDILKEGGPYTINYTATDSSGNQGIANRYVYVVSLPTQDTVKPVISMSDSILYITQGKPFTDPGASAFDLTDGNLTSRVVATGSVDINTPGTYTITYSVHDNAGNVQTATRTVIVQIGGTGTDITAPVIDLQGSDTILLPEGVTITEYELTYQEPGYTATDTRDGDITDNVTTSGFQQQNPKYWYISYDVTDSAGNAAATVRRYFDTGLPETMELPVIDLEYPDSVIQLILGVTPWIEPGYTASDVVDGDITDKVIIDSSDLINNITTQGIYTVVYEVTNSLGGTSRKVRYVSVTDNRPDNTPPVITLNGQNPDTVVVNSTAGYTDPGYSALDNKDGDVTADVQSSGNVNVNSIGRYIITYSVRDAADNRGTATRTVWVIRDVTSDDIFVRYGVPSENPLPSIDNVSYLDFEVDGEGPDLITAGVRSLVFSWNLITKSIYNFQMNFIGADALDLNSTSHTFDSENPAMTLSGTGIPGLDGDYYVAVQGDEFYWVEKEGTFAIIWMRF